MMGTCESELKPLLTWQVASQEEKDFTEKMK